MTSGLDRTAAIVVHHKNFPQVTLTVDDLLSTGIPANNVVVVDNSEDEGTEDKLRHYLHPQIKLLTAPNYGYGMAANAGLDEIFGRDAPVESILISSHETRFPPKTLGVLVAQLDRDSSIGAAGPVLFMKDEPDQLWSAGGSLSKYLKRPVHRMQIPSDPVSATWLDGAFVLYRAEAIRSARFDPVYRMYYEETDLHLRLGAAGWRVSVVPQAIVYQATAGAPPFYVGRNGYLFGKRYTTIVQRWAALGREALRFAVRGHGRTSRRAAVRAYVQGMIDGIKT
ncbi:glycosyltransferase family 2 protein [Microbacterium invictum]|uniref:Glycosyltransferase family 2 protein n=1 Tax=Microbacterium invictum TaxID=515415 RepID=A0ABZ0VAG3_9MICO|nr:glycosyltransferase family 2 protein [Microbacterium invictum]WQB69797.1 glycosyltransferase family 2 protein [Microbacterium invictum]